MESQKEIKNNLVKKVGLNGKMGERKSSLNLRPIQAKNALKHNVRTKVDIAENREANFKVTGDDADNDKRKLTKKVRSTSDKKVKDSRLSLVKVKGLSSYRQEVCKENDQPLIVALEDIEVDTEGASYDEYSTRRLALDGEPTSDVEKMIHEEARDDYIDNIVINQVETVERSARNGHKNKEEKVSFQYVLKNFDSAFLTLGQFVGQHTCGDFGDFEMNDSQNQVKYRQQQLDYSNSDKSVVDKYTSSDEIRIRDRNCKENEFQGIIRDPLQEYIFNNSSAEYNKYNSNNKIYG